MTLATVSTKRSRPVESMIEPGPAKQLCTTLNVNKAPQSRLTGISYTVTNKFGVKSYFIGTCHFVDKEAFENPLLQEMINKSSILYTEAGPYVFNLFPFGTQKNENPKYQHNPFRYPLDVRITEMAAKRKILTIALDEGVPEQDRWLRSSYELRVEEGAEAAEDKFRRGWEKDMGTKVNQEAFVAWKNGDIPSLPKIGKKLSEESLEREAHWAKQLIPKLDRTRYPICVAVGATHLTTAGSLLERCKRVGYKVQLITTAADI